MVLAAVTQVGGIDGILQNVPGWATEWVRSVNVLIDVPLAGMMAGLALASGVIAAGAAGTLDASHAAIRANKGIVEKTAQSRLTNLRSAACALFSAFCAFSACLIIECTLDAALKSPAQSWLGWQDAAKLLASGGSSAWGLLCMMKAANVLRKSP